MSHFADMMNSGEDLLFGTFGGTSVVFNGSADVAITDAWKGEEVREPGLDRTPDVVRVSWRFRASQLSAITPSPKNTITEGAKIWTVDTVTPYGQGEFLTVTSSRRVQRGAA